MFERETAKYLRLNKLAETDSIVLLGTGSDTELPLAELSGAFDLDIKIYNRSAESLSVKNAADYFKTLVQPLQAGRIILHLGETDLDLFSSDLTGFDRAYRNLISVIRSSDSRCRIGIISLKNPSKDASIAEMNAFLSALAESEGCEFEDISVPRVWNPSATKSAMAFASAMGLNRRIRREKSLYDLAKILFYYEEPADSFEAAAEYPQYADARAVFA